MQDALMSRARYVQENRKMRFEEAYEGWSLGRLIQAEAALLLGQASAVFAATSSATRPAGWTVCWTGA
jgi:hypothetical protein